MKLHVPVIVCLVLLANGCRVPDGQIVRDGSTITVRGPITEGLDRRIVGRLDGVRTFVINSAGGDERTAIRIGLALASRPDLALSVEGQCLSACAQYIFAAVQRKHIQEDAIVGCHSNTIAAIEVSTAAYGSRFTKRELERADEARDLYRRAGIPIAFARLCMINVTPICYYTDARGMKGFRTTVDIWVPTAADFRLLGIPGVEGAPLTQQAARDLATASGLTSLLQPTTDADLAALVLRRQSRSCDELIRNFDGPPP